MPEKHGRKQAKLTPEMEAKQWQKGQSGNPKGRSKGVRSFSEVAREMLNAKKLDVTITLPNGHKKSLCVGTNNTFYHAICAALIIEGVKGNVKAVKELIDRTEGRPKDIENSQQLDLKEFAEVLKGNYRHE